MTKQVLSILQMKHLEELGMDTIGASMCWSKTPTGRELVINDGLLIGEVKYGMCTIPTYTLQDVLDALPEEITYKRKDYLIEIWKRDSEWSVGYLFFDDEDVIHLHDETNKSFINAAYSMLCWCIENGYVETNKTNKPCE